MVAKECIYTKYSLPVAWQFDNNTELSKFLKLHEEYADLVIEYFNLDVLNGSLVIPPICQLVTEDKIPHEIHDYVN